MLAPHHKLRFTMQNGNATNAEAPNEPFNENHNLAAQSGNQTDRRCSWCAWFCSPDAASRRSMRSLSSKRPQPSKNCLRINSKNVEGWKAAEPRDDTLRGNWWEMFHELELNALENQVANSNQNVAVALANFLAARAVVKQTRSQYFPTVTASPSVTRARQSSVQTQSGSSPASFTATEYSLPFDASWELDFWGRIRNSVKANSLEAQATFADLENVRLTVQAEAAADYFQLRVLDAQRGALGCGGARLSKGRLS